RCEREGLAVDRAEDLCGQPLKLHPTACYRLEYCGRLRALWRPYFLRSTSRGSRVSIPFFRSGTRRGSELVCRAREMPWRTASACAELPPPLTLMMASNCPTVSVTSKGSRIRVRAVSLGK